MPSLASRRRQKALGDKRSSVTRPPNRIDAIQNAVAGWISKLAPGVLFSMTVLVLYHGISNFERGNDSLLVFATENFYSQQAEESIDKPSLDVISSEIVSIDNPFSAGRTPQTSSNSDNIQKEGDTDSENIEIDQSSSSSKEVQKLEDFKRSIVLIHVGKCGGSTLRIMGGILCKQDRDPEDPRKIVKRYCEARKSPKEPQGTTIIGRLVKDDFHMWSYNETLFPEVSSFLVTIRNPVERVISTYRYSHPGNCPENQNPREPEPWACHLPKHGKLGPPPNPQDMDLDRYIGYKLYKRCFPSPAMEDFAATLTSPWLPIKHFMETIEARSDRWKCRKLAIGLVQGLPNFLAAPHMEYNYQYYMSKTVDKFPEKEVFVMRTEHEWDDLINLEKLLGGSGSFQHAGQAISHGSAKYAPSPLSSESYQKLCCVLADEIDNYKRVLFKARNLSPADKQGSWHEVLQKCGIAMEPESAWDSWKAECKQQLATDMEYLNRMIEYDK